MRSLYVHIPFCERKCGYCDFPSLAGLEGADGYVRALRWELRKLGAALGPLTLDTIFFGGGTPGLLDVGLLRSILDEVRADFAVAPSAEVTLEANPSSTTEERARGWLDTGFNRVSIGIQSLAPDILRFLGRVHDADRALAAVDEVRAAGFDAINCDLIYAVPGLDERHWRATLEQVVARDPGHISAYELTFEPGTPLHAAATRGRVRPVQEETALRQHREAVEVLGRAGYRQYEVSNFARPGRECLHNLVYWRNGHYLAAGLGAHGHLPLTMAAALGLEAAPGAVAVRYWHPRRLTDYLRLCGEGGLPIAGWEAVDAGGREAERVMLGLRLAEGVSAAGLAAPAVHDLAGRGLLAVEEGRVRTTRRGEEVLNGLAARLTEPAAASTAR